MVKNKRPPVIEFQNKIISILENKVPIEIIDQIIHTDSKSQIRKIIAKLTEYHDLLRENKVRVYQDSNKENKKSNFKIKKKPNFKDDYFDNTISSVRAIYTPMGNKR